MIDGHRILASLAKEEESGRHEARAPYKQNAHRSDTPNPYPPARRMLGRFAPGIRRASGPGQVIADVSRIE